MTVCSTCNDTHRMTLRDREVMCTRCPTPCFDCGKGGPFCTATPCACWCHRGSNCSLCGKWLGRQSADGSHYNCRLSLEHSLRALGRGLVDAGIAERAFRLGNLNGWDEAAISEGYRSANSWTPGCGRSAP